MSAGSLPAVFFWGLMKQEFYEKLMPPSGVYCVATLLNGSMKSKFTESIDELINITDSFNSEGRDVYVSPNSFSGFSRQSKYAAHAKSFFIDLDVGENKGYLSQHEALEHLDKTVTALGLPYPTLVNSGTGIQAYWILDQAISIAEWRPLAEDIKQFCIGHGLKIDAVVTSDVSRLMRCPDTFNYKTAPPSPTHLISEEILLRTLQEIKAGFQGSQQTVEAPPVALEEASNVTQVLATVPKGLDEATAAVGKKMYEDIESYFADIVTKSLSDMGCAQIRRLLEEPTKQNYNEWFWGLSIASRCVDAETAIQDFSVGHAGYNAASTIAKAKETLKATGPQRCSVIEALHPAGCEGCVYKGRIGSPLSLGRRVKALPPSKMPGDMPELPEQVAPYSWSEGGIWYTPPPELAKNGKWMQADPYLVCRNIFYPVARMFGKQDGAMLVVRAILSKDPDREFYLPVKHIAGNDKFRETLGMYDITPASPNPTMVNRMADYTLRWNEYLKTIQSADVMQAQMGWTEDRLSFVMGNREITYDGDMRRTAAALAIKKIADLLNPVGTYEKWKESANALNGEGMEHLALGLFTGFGSPLMEFTNTPGVTVCFTGESGAGKSGTLYSGLSIWGDPQMLAPQERGATKNALVQRYLTLKNILMGVDEVHNILPETLSDFIFMVSTGKGKIRMYSSHNAERDLENQAKLICMLNSNTDLNMLLKVNKANPEGEYARFIQFMFRKPELFVVNPDEAPRILNPFNSNYGHAGVEYLGVLYGLGLDTVAEKVEYWGSRFDKSYGKHTRYRFYRSFIATTFAGADIANKAGIIKLDVERIYTSILDDMIYDRDKVGDRNVDYVEMLNTFMNENIGLFLKVDGKDIIDAPVYFKEFIGRKELDTNIVYVNRVALHRYLSDPKRKVNVAQFDHSLREAGVLLHENKKKRLGAYWAKASDVGPVNCYWFKMDVKDVTNPSSE